MSTDKQLEQAARLGFTIAYFAREPESSDDRLLACVDCRVAGFANPHKPGAYCSSCGANMIPIADLVTASCIGCGCDDWNACADEQTCAPCHWLRVDRSEGLGVCSACPELVEAWDRGDREFRVPMGDSHG